MTFPYLGHRRWAEISREERLFCAELFFAIRGDESRFVGWLNERIPSLRLDASEPWEVGYEVCFYRDLLFGSGLPVRPSPFSGKRTFDLCLFSVGQIVVIEAKAQAGFSARQNEEFEADLDHVPACISAAGFGATCPRVSFVALASSRYLQNVERYGRGLPEVFDGAVSWRDVNDSFASRALFERADAVYGN